jgi:hypothetical protein
MLVCKVAKWVGSSRVRSLHPPLPPREPQRASHYLLCGFAIKSLHSGHGESNSDWSRAHFVPNICCFNLPKLFETQATRITKLVIYIS